MHTTFLTLEEKSESCIVYVLASQIALDTSACVSALTLCKISSMLLNKKKARTAAKDKQHRLLSVLLRACSLLPTLLCLGHLLTPVWSPCGPEREMLLTVCCLFLVGSV